MRDFNTSNIPSQEGRVAIVTGANVGLGFETTRGLAEKGIKVIMACRNEEKAEKAKQQLLQQLPDADLEIRLIDLSKLASVRAFAQAYRNDYDRLDLLINNAGVMMPPYQKTEDGLELQMAANYFGHFLLTGLLLDALIRTPGSRVVSLSSSAHKSAKINFDDLQSERHYSAWRAYGQSKLACLMFSYELQRRLEKAGHGTISTAAHPGGSNTNLGQHMPKWFEVVSPVIFPLVTHPPADAVRRAGRRRARRRLLRSDRFYGNEGCPRGSSFLGPVARPEGGRATLAGFRRADGYYLLTSFVGRFAGGSGLSDFFSSLS